MTETGIDIEARLPGRREQGLSLLSGGERSLTAAALGVCIVTGYHRHHFASWMKSMQCWTKPMWAGSEIC